MCDFVSRPMKIVTFLWKNGDNPKRVVDFPLERDTFRNKIIEIVEDFDEKSYNNNGKQWKSSRILRVKATFLHFSFFFHHFFSIFSFFSFIPPSLHFTSFLPTFSFLHHFHFLLLNHFSIFLIFFICSFSYIFFIFVHFLSFSFMFFHFPIIFFHFPFIFLCFPSFSFIFLHFHSFSIIFYHFLSFSFIFFHVLSCSFMFFHVLSCSFIFFYFLLFSFIFFHFLSFSFIFFHFVIFFHFLSCYFFFFFCFFFLFVFFCRGIKICFFFWPQFRYDFSSHFSSKKFNFSAVSGDCTSFETFLPFFVSSPFFPPSFFLLVLFLFLGSCSSFLSFLIFSKKICSVFFVF